MPQPQVCPDNSTLRDFLHDGLAGADAERVDDHIGGCPACQRALDRLVGSLPRGWLPVTAGPRDDPPWEYASTATPGAMPRILPSDGEPGAGVIPGPAARPGSPEAPTVADRSARLHLFDEVARGGMGVILRARDAALGRDLAVKLLLERHRNNPELIRRFVMEARIAGQLQHPGMVPVHELGALDDGRPYFAMKLVKGRTMEALLKERNDPSEDLPRFLGIFEQVCQTVAYAHARGVIHRDLKPANVMVGRFGEVQVMDWGLAKVLPSAGAARAGDASGDGALSETQHEPGDATLGETRHASGDLTHHGSVLGTWAYMPPEQARGLVAEVDRRSDVFGLGAVLCEILTGQPPYTGSAAESVQLQAMEARLDGASARLGDCGADPELIRLAMRCLASDSDDRPADGGEVASAVAEYRSSVQESLQQERLARERQEVRAAEGRRRHRVWAAATLGVLLALTLGVATSTIFALGERAARQKATQQALMAEESLFLLEDVLAQADPESESNRDITLREAVDRTTRKLNQGDLKNDVKTPESNARVRITLGKIYFNLGEYRQSRDLFAEAHRIAREELGEGHPTAMTALDQLGKAYMYLDEFVDAERVLTRAYELQRKVLGPEHEDTVHTHAKLADLYADMGKLDRAREIGESVLSLRRRLWGDEYEFTLVSMNNLGLLYRDLGRPADALRFFEEVERINRRTRGEDHPATLTNKHNRAMALADLGRREEALRQLSECLAAERRILGESHPATLKTEFSIATLMFKMGQHAESIRISESILGRLGTRIAGDHSFRGNVLVNLGRCFTATGKYPEAERALREAQAIFSKKVGPEHRFSRDAAKALAELLERKARPQAEEGNPSQLPMS
jgi:serine/threonine protein kinase